MGKDRPATVGVLFFFAHKNKKKSIILATLAAAASLGSAIYGGIKSGILNRQAEQILKSQQADNEEWYNVKRAEDYTQRADVQAAIQKQRLRVSSIVVSEGPTTISANCSISPILVRMTGF